MDYLVQEVSTALAYEGFDPAKMREEAIARLSATELVTLISAYVTVGNNLTGRVSAGKVSNKAEAESILKMMKAKGVVAKAASGTDLTLPRLAASFPALLIGIRHRVKEVRRVDTSTPWHLQDSALNGYANTVAASGCEDFIKKFAMVLAAAADKKSGAKTARSEEEVMRPVLELRAIAKANQEKDPMIGMMSKPITADMTIESILEGYGFETKAKSRIPPVPAPVSSADKSDKGLKTGASASSASEPAATAEKAASGGKS